MVAAEVIRSIEDKALKMRELIVTDLIGEGKVGHLGGSCSSAEIVAALYFHKMKHDPANPKNPDRDRFLLSKGHAALVQYAALALAGYFPVSELKKVTSSNATSIRPDCRSRMASDELPYSRIVATSLKF